MRLATFIYQHHTINETEDRLLTVTASDGHTSFLTTLQIITKQGIKPISVKVDPDTDVNTVSLSHYRKLFRKNFTKAGHLKYNVLHPTTHLWALHDSKPQQFIGYFIVDIHQNTLLKVLQVRFYVFEDTTCSKILLSYATSVRLGIIDFKVPNKASTPSALDTISTTKNVTFSKPLHAEKVPPHNPSNTTLRSVIKKQHIPRPLLTGP